MILISGMLTLEKTRIPSSQDIPQVHVNGHCSRCNRPFHGFIFQLTFDKDKLANIHLHYWNERLKISKLVKYESDMSNVSEDIPLQSREILQMCGSQLSYVALSRGL